VPHAFFVIANKLIGKMRFDHYQNICRCSFYIGFANSPWAEKILELGQLHGRHILVSSREKR
jgi:hypothetical protein